MTTSSMDGRTVVITGGNSGIGLETAVGLASMGARIVLGCRDAAKADAAVADIRSRSGNDAVENRPLDLADLTSVAGFASSLGDLDRIDVLVNNAGLIMDRRVETAQGFEATFGINHLGHFLLTRLVDPQLRAAPAARVVCVASLAHAAAVGGLTWGDLDRHHRFSAWRVYGESKLANILHAQALARRLEGSGIVAHSLHPGSVRTNFGAEGDTQGANARFIRMGDPFAITAEEGARTSIHVASSPEAGTTTGLYWARSRPGRLAPWAMRRGAPEQLWATSERMLAAVDAPSSV
jgi:NAD(P)-dependent dehydrogenase (short-subunit alcohol dehydrogenase family)